MSLPSTIMRNSRPARIGRTISALTTALVIAGCGVRVGQPPVPIPIPDADEAQRQHIAVALEQVLLAADVASKEEGDAADRLSVVLEAYLEDLGGVWLPPPREEDPEPSSPALADPPATLAEAAELSAGELAEALPQAPEVQRGALVSMWLTLRTAQATFGAEPAADCELPCGEAMIPPIDPVPESGELAAIYDALGYLQEIRAARAGTDARDDDAAGARALRLFAEELSGTLSGTDADLRQGAYPVDPDDLSGSSQTYLEAALEQWLVLAADAGDPEFLEALWHTSMVVNPGHEISPWPGLASQ